jgi:hypothetical protein
MESFLAPLEAPHIFENAVYLKIFDGVQGEANLLKLEVMTSEIPAFKLFFNTIDGLLGLIDIANKSSQATEAEAQRVHIKHLLEKVMAVKEAVGNAHLGLKQFQRNAKLFPREKDELQVLRAEILRYQYKEQSGTYSTGAALKNRCSEQSRVILERSDQLKEAKKNLNFVIKRQRQELSRIQSEFKPLGQRMAKWQGEISEIRDVIYVRERHTVDVLQENIASMKKQMDELVRTKQKEVEQIATATEQIKVSWASKEHGYRRLLTAYNSLLPYVSGQGVQLSRGHYDIQSDHCTLAQGIDALREELDTLEGKYSRACRDLQFARSECESIRSQYMEKVMERQAERTAFLEKRLVKRAEGKRETVDVSLVLQRKHAEQLRSIQNRHSVELKLRDQELEEVKQESNRLSAALADTLDKLDRRRNFTELVNTSTARDQNFVQPRVHLGAEHQASASTQQGTRRKPPVVPPMVTPGPEAPFIVSPTVQEVGAPDVEAKDRGVKKSLKSSFLAVASAEIKKNKFSSLNSSKWGKIKKMALQAQKGKTKSK